MFVGTNFVSFCFLHFRRIHASTSRHSQTHQGFCTHSKNKSFCKIQEIEVMNSKNVDSVPTPISKIYFLKTDLTFILGAMPLLTKIYFNILLKFMR